MGNDRAGKLYIRLLDVAPHINSAINRQNNASGVIRPNGEHAYFYKGREISPEEFNKKFPIKSPRPNINRYGGHVDKRQIPKH